MNCVSDIIQDAKLILKDNDISLKKHDKKFIKFKRELLKDIEKFQSDHQDLEKYFNMDKRKFSKKVLKDLMYKLGNFE